MIVVQNLKFENVTHENKSAGRPFKLRGSNIRNRPQAEEIPEEAFESPRKLFTKLYGLKFRVQCFMRSLISFFLTFA